MFTRLFFFIFSFFCLIETYSIAQLPVFNQYSQNQLNINPAFAGYFDDEVKFDALYRNQAYANINTTSFYNASLQLKPFKEYMLDQDVLGFGINMYSTKSLSVYSQQSVSGSLSYLKSLSVDGSQSLSMGFQGRFNSKRIDYTSLLFPNQFDVIGYNFQLPNNEPIQVINANYFDINAGLMYSSKTETEEFTTGFSMYNLNQTSADKSMLQNRQGLTYMLHAGYSKYLSESGQVFLGILHSSMKTQNATSIIAAYGATPETNSLFGLNAGAVYQLNNSISPFINLHFNSIKVSFAYDILVSPDISYSQKSTSMEFGIQYLFTSPSAEQSLAKKHMSCF